MNTLRRLCWAAAVPVAVAALGASPASAASAVPIELPEEEQVLPGAGTGGASASASALRRVAPVQSSKAWVDVSNDARADFCRLVGSGANYVQCTLSAGGGFGGTHTSGWLDPGDAAGRAWADFNGDGRADYCRVTGSWDKYLRCTVSTGTGFGTTHASSRIDPGYDAGRAWADFNGDGRADYCRVVGGWDKSVQCTVSTGTGFGGTYTSAALDPGHDAGRAWADVNADGRADYCRLVGSYDARCATSLGTGFASGFSAYVGDHGWGDSRAWADVTGDGRADYCRVTGLDQFTCNPSTGGGFGRAFSSGAVDPGYAAGRAWADFDGDAKADPCRVVGGGDRFLQCTASTGTGFGATYTSGWVDPGYDAGRAWADFSGDGRADYCRVIGSWDKSLQCTTSTGTGFGATLTSGVVDPGWD